jgi:mediator of RNA polymerase II transcription subunit 16
MPEGHEIVHLSYSPMGNDLAVIDSAGRLMLYTTGFTLYSMMLMHTAAHDSDDEMNAIGGLHWLPVFPHTQKV